MIAVVSHDAGGGEILSSYIRREGIECHLVLAGPAVPVFERKLGLIKCVDLDTALCDCDWMLCGSSYPSTFELEAIDKARERGIQSIVFLDHWINYRQRFERDAYRILPDEIWVGDADAERIAKSVFPDTQITQIDNPYFADVKDYIGSHRTTLGGDDSKVRALFLSQPIAAHAVGVSNVALQRGYTESEALRYFLRNLNLLGKKLDEVVIRLHPSEELGKYDGIIGEFDLPVTIANNTGLVDAILAADFIVGMDSMAMVVGLLAEKTVVCCIPPQGKPCRLPHAKILRLSD